MTWRAIADHVLRNDGSGPIGTIEPIGGEEGANVPNVPIVPLSPSQALKVWADGLKCADPRCPPDGWTPARWGRLCDDAAFILEGFGAQAARDGWSTADLFGLWPNKPHWGGVADRLQGCRALVLTADRAHWRALGVVDRFNRGSYPDLRPFWESAQ